MNGADRTRVAFGRRGRENGAPAAAVRHSDSPSQVPRHKGRLFALTVPLLAIVGALFWMLPDILDLNGELVRTEQRVIDVVNQPVTHLPRSGQFGVFSPGWFHPGAETPDFDNVDIRTTQQFPYQAYSYVTSDVNPSEMFVADELEFNPMTKYFYTDRTLPKKRLSDAEMVQINGLYRVIGHDKRALFLRATIAGALVIGFFLGVAGLVMIGRNSAARAD